MLQITNFVKNEYLCIVDYILICFSYKKDIGRLLFGITEDYYE